MIEATAELNACRFVVTADQENMGWYQIQSASGYYIAGTLASNKAKNGVVTTKDATKTSSYLNKFLFANNVVSVKSKSSDKEMVLKYNNASDQNRFRYYSSGQKDIALYKLVSTSPIFPLTSITISGTPTKTNYEEGDVFDPAGLVVTGTCEDGTTKQITSGIEWTVDPETLAEGTTSVDVMASVGDVVSDVFTVNGLTVTGKLTLIGIEAKGTPSEFWLGDTFNHDGITVTALWSDDTETDVTSECEFSTRLSRKLVGTKLHYCIKSVSFASWNRTI